MIRLISEENTKMDIAELVLADLQDWFGIPEYTRKYSTESASMPFWAAFDGTKPIGFAALKQTSSDTAEIYVMGVMKDYHRSGTGKQLFLSMQQYASDQGFSFLQVKTVQMGHYEEYDRTNRFYLAMGFRELECFPTLWDPWNPCMIYIKYIGREK